MREKCAFLLSTTLSVLPLSGKPTLVAHVPQREAACVVHAEDHGPVVGHELQVRHGLHRAALHHGRGQVVVHVPQENVPVLVGRQKVALVHARPVEARAAALVLFNFRVDLHVAVGLHQTADREVLAKGQQRVRVRERAGHHALDALGAGPALGHEVLAGGGHELGRLAAGKGVRALRAADFARVDVWSGYCPS